MEYDSAPENSSPSYEPYFQDPDNEQEAEFQPIGRALSHLESRLRISPSESISYGRISSSAAESGSELEAGQPHAKL